MKIAWPWLQGFYTLVWTKIDAQAKLISCAPYSKYFQSCWDISVLQITTLETAYTFHEKKTKMKSIGSHDCEEQHYWPFTRKWRKAGKVSDGRDCEVKEQVYIFKRFPHDLRIAQRKSVVGLEISSWIFLIVEFMIWIP